MSPRSRNIHYNTLDILMQICVEFYTVEARVHARGLQFIYDT